MTAILKREFRSYFRSMTGNVFMALLIVFTGIYFMAYNLNAGYPYFAYALGGSLIVFLVAIPILTMRSFSEERKNKTDQLLLTSPVGLWQVVLGKYLAMVSVLAVTMLVYCIFPLIIKLQGIAYLGVDYLSIFVFFLLGCVYISIGMFISSLTESQIIASISTFGILLVLYMWDGILGFFPESAVGGLLGFLVIVLFLAFYIYHMTGNKVLCASIGGVAALGGIVAYFVKSTLFENFFVKCLSFLSLTDTFATITDSHILDLGGILLYLSLILVFVFLTVQTFQKRRWS